MRLGSILPRKRRKLSKQAKALRLPKPRKRRKLSKQAKAMRLRNAKIKAVKELATYDHAFIPKDIVKRLTKPWRFMGSTFIDRNQPDHPKGLMLPKGITELEGQDAQVTAMEICRHAGVEYRAYIGRGFQLQACVDALKKHLGMEDSDDPLRINVPSARGFPPR
jgi:hypothetical protein